MLFAWKVCKHVRSNAIVLVQGPRHRGHRRRADEPRRLRAPGGREVPSAESLEGAALASDAFFPFADGPQLAIDAGVTAIIQPGGSLRDHEVVEAADAAGHRDGLHEPPALPALTGLGRRAFFCLGAGRGAGGLVHPTGAQRCGRITSNTPPGGRGGGGTVAGGERAGQQRDGGRGWGRCWGGCWRFSFAAFAACRVGGLTGGTGGSRGGRGGRLGGGRTVRRGVGGGGWARGGERRVGGSGGAVIKGWEKTTGRAR